MRNNNDTIERTLTAEIKLRYELTPYSNGNPPWKSKDHSSEWLANHSSPSAMLFVPESAAPKRTLRAHTGINFGLFAESRDKLTQLSAFIARQICNKLFIVAHRGASPPQNFLAALISRINGISKNFHFRGAPPPAHSASKTSSNSFTPVQDLDPAARQGQK